MDTMTFGNIAVDVNQDTFVQRYPSAANRIDAIFDILLRCGPGKRASRAMHALAEQDRWGVSVSTIDYYRVQAGKLYESHRHKKREDDIAWHLRIARRGIERALEKGDDQLLLQFLRHHVLVGGLEPKDDNAILCRRYLEQLQNELSEIAKSKAKQLTTPLEIPPAQVSVEQVEHLKEKE
jgi:hypothetical protein